MIELEALDRLHDAIQRLIVSLLVIEKATLICLLLLIADDHVSGELIRYRIVFTFGLLLSIFNEFIRLSF